MLRVQPSKLGVVLSAYSSSVRATGRGEYINYDSLFWSTEMFNAYTDYAKRHSHLLYYEYLCNEGLLSPVACFSDPLSTGKRIQYIKKGILDKTPEEILPKMKEDDAERTRNFWDYPSAIADCEYLASKPAAYDSDSEMAYRNRPLSILNTIEGLDTIAEFLPKKALPSKCTQYISLHLSKYYGKPGAHIGNNSVLIAGVDGSLIYSIKYRDNSLRKRAEFVGRYLDPTGYVVVTPNSDIYVVLQESKVRYSRILELDLNLPKSVSSVMLWAILYTLLKEDGSVFDFVSGLMEKQVDSIMSESIIMGTRANPAELEHEEDGSITDLVSSIARKVKLVTYPVAMRGLGSK